MTDPVCGMEVDPGTAAAAWDHDGTTYYFCSVGCFERFRDDPPGFLERDPTERGM
jgi:YHS domain-containing protein